MGKLNSRIMDPLCGYLFLALLFLYLFFWICKFEAKIFTKNEMKCYCKCQCHERFF